MDAFQIHPPHFLPANDKSYDPLLDPFLPADLDSNGLPLSFADSLAMNMGIHDDSSNNMDYDLISPTPRARAFPSNVQNSMGMGMGMGMMNGNGFNNANASLDAPTPRAPAFPSNIQQQRQPHYAISSTYSFPPPPPLSRTVSSPPKVTLSTNGAPATSPAPLSPSNSSASPTSARINPFAPFEPSHGTAPLTLAHRRRGSSISSLAINVSSPTATSMPPPPVLNGANAGAATQASIAATAANEVSVEEIAESEADEAREEEPRKERERQRTTGPARTNKRKTTQQSASRRRPSVASSRSRSRSSMRTTTSDDPSDDPSFLSDASASEREPSQQQHPMHAMTTTFGIAPPPSSSASSISSFGSGAGAVGPGERRPKRGDEDYIKRPENAFILFRRDCCMRKNMEEARLVAEAAAAASSGDNAGNNDGAAAAAAAMALPKRQRQADLSKTISQQWRSLSKEERKYWDDLAKQRKKEHEEMFPWYVYQPARAGAKKEGGAEADGEKKARDGEEEGEKKKKTSTKAKSESGGSNKKRLGHRRPTSVASSRRSSLASTSEVATSDEDDDEYEYGAEERRKKARRDRRASALSGKRRAPSVASSLSTTTTTEESASEVELGFPASVSGGSDGGDFGAQSNAFYGSYGFGFGAAAAYPPSISSHSSESSSFTWGTDDGAGMEIDIGNGMRFDSGEIEPNNNATSNVAPAPGMGPLATIAQNLSNMNVQKDGASTKGPRGHTRAESTQLPASVAGAERFSFTGMNTNGNGAGMANFVLPVGRRACSAPRSASAQGISGEDANGSGIKIPTLLPVGLGNSNASEKKAPTHGRAHSQSLSLAMPPSFGNIASVSHTELSEKEKSGGEESAPESASPATPANQINNSAYNAFVATHPSLRRESAINLRAVAASMSAPGGFGGMDMQMGLPMSMPMPNNNGGFPTMSMNDGGMVAGMMDASHDLPSWALETYYAVDEPSSSSATSSSMAENGGDGGDASRQQSTAHVENDAFRFPADFLPGPSSSSSTDAPSPAHSDASHGSGSSAGSSSVGNIPTHMPMNGFEMGGMMDLDSLPLHFAPPTSSASSSPIPAPASTQQQQQQTSNDPNSTNEMITFHNPFASPYGDHEHAHALSLDVPLSVDDPLLGMGLQFSFEDYDLLDPSQF